MKYTNDDRLRAINVALAECAVAQAARAQFVPVRDCLLVRHRGYDPYNSADYLIAWGRGL